MTPDQIEMARQRVALMRSCSSLSDMECVGVLLMHENKGYARAGAYGMQLLDRQRLNTGGTVMVARYTPQMQALEVAGR